MDLDDFTTPESLSEIVEEDAEFNDVNVEQQMQFSIDNIVAEVAALHQTIKERLAYDHVKEEAFDRLYAEVEEVRQERSFQQVRPLLMDLILLYDRIELGIQQMYGLEGNMPDVAQLLKSFRDELLEILYRREVEAIIASSSTFDRTVQQAIKIQPTAFADEHNQVVRVVRRGFRLRGIINGIHVNIQSMLKRHFHGNWFAAGFATLLGLIMLLGGGFGWGSLYLVCGVGYAVSYFIPQYLINRRIIEGKSLSANNFLASIFIEGGVGCGGMLIGLLIIMLTLPIVMVVNFLRNWVLAPQPTAAEKQRLARSQTTQPQAMPEMVINQQQRR